MKHPATGMTFTDNEVTSACNLHLDNLRRLITWRAVQPEQAGGGRGRVRLWTLKQAQRIAVTAQFASAGLSLKMAHTLAYCLPIDDMLQAFDPDYIASHARAAPPEGWGLVFKEEPVKVEDDYDLVGHVKIADGRYVFGDLLGDDDCLFGEFDKERNLYVAYWDPFTWYYGLLTDTKGKRPKPGALTIDRSSLLVEYEPDRRPEKFYTEDASFFTQINLGFGLTLATRRLLKLPVVHPIYGDTHE